MSNSQIKSLPEKSTLWAKSVLLPDGWASDVAIAIDADGNILSVQSGSVATGCEILDGAVIAGIPNLHSHAHQRAMAGLGERAGLSEGGGGVDSFWTWRKVMYHYLERIQPCHLLHIARQLYLEMLKSGFTSVAEFQYLHHDTNGQPFTEKAEMTQQCLQAALQVGIGFTALPVLYNYGGFGGKPATDGQKRFLNQADSFCEIANQLIATTGDNPNCATGIAPHSLRAVTRELLQDVLSMLQADRLAAVHVHIAEQIGEVDDCIEWSGRRPVQWLFDNFEVDDSWCLVHATHMTEAETAMLAGSGAVAGLCPTTEANLGDGFFNASQFMSAGGRWGIGSDSHISISPVEELRWLEYGQRLLQRSRNLLGSPEFPNTGRSLVNSALAGGAQACGRRIGRLAPDYRADLLVLDHNHPRLYRRNGDDLIDSWIFSGNDNPVMDVYVGGVRVIEKGRHHNEGEIQQAFNQTMDQLAN
jgi:formimidoylglutamate deiminase